MRRRREGRRCGEKAGETFRKAPKPLQRTVTLHYELMYLLEPFIQLHLGLFLA